MLNESGNIFNYSEEVVGRHQAIEKHYLLGIRNEEEQSPKNEKRSSLDVKLALPSTDEEHLQTKKLALMSQDNPFLERQYNLTKTNSNSVDALNNQQSQAYNISAFPNVQSIPVDLLPFIKKAKIAKRTQE